MYFPLPGASQGPLCPSLFQGTILLLWSGHKREQLRWKLRLDPAWPTLFGEFPSWPSRLRPHVRLLQAGCGSLPGLSNPTFGTSEACDLLPHRNPSHATLHLKGFTQHRGPFWDLFFGQLPEDPRQRKSQRNGKHPFPFQVVSRKEEADDRSINHDCRVLF